VFFMRPCRGESFLGAKQVEDNHDSLFTILNSTTMSKVDSDYLRMAVGFLDTNKLMEVGPYKSFVALVSLTKKEIQTQRKFQIPVRTVMEEMGITSNNYNLLKDNIRLLMETVLDFNVHRKDRNPGWSMAQILGPSQLKDGIITFEFTEPVWDKLKDPIIYAYITRKGVYSFKSKYDIALYNWFTRLLVPDHDQVICEETISFILNDILHIDKKLQKTYGGYMRLNDKILKKSIESINKQTNINVKYKGLRTGRFVTKVWFFVSRQAPELKAEEQQVLSKLVTVQLNKLVKLGLSLDSKVKERVLALSKELGEEFCVQRLTAIAKEVKSRPNGFSNPGGYIRTKLFENILLPEETNSELPHQDFVDRYLQFFQQAFKSLWSDYQLGLFKQYSSEKFEELQPRIVELCGGDASFRALTKGATLNKEIFLKSRSLLSVANAKAELLGFVMPPTNQQEWVEQHKDTLLAKVRDMLQVDSKLRYEMADSGCKSHEIEALAFLQFMNQVTG